MQTNHAFAAVAAKDWRAYAYSSEVASAAAWAAAFSERNRPHKSISQATRPSACWLLWLRRSAST